MARIQEFDFAVDLTQALLWQYNDAARLQMLITAKQAWYDGNVNQFWLDWYRDVFDLRTANEFGLGIWAQLLGIPLVANAPPPDTRDVFGFGEFNLNFYNSDFGHDVSALALTTEEKRLLLRLRYYQIVTDGCVTSINAMLADVFRDYGPVYVLDGLNMTCEYVFQFFPSSKLTFILENFDILPRPDGVQMSILINPGDSFGFAPYYLNFRSNFVG